MRRRLLLVTVLLLSACQSNSGIGVSPGQCCPDRTYRSFSTIQENMPSFLAPLMINNFNTAFSGVGMNLVEGQADLGVTLRYLQEDISGVELLDDFEGHLEPGGNVRFVAKVMVEIRDSATGDMVWSGSVQRIHDVDAGEYMHAGRASLGILKAFQELLASYPSIP